MNRVITPPSIGLALLALVIWPGCGRQPGDGTGPRISTYSNSGCLPGTGNDHDQTLDEFLDVLDGYPGCGVDQIELAVEDGRLHVVHRNATYNCCPDDIEVTLSVEGTSVTVTEREDLTTGGCFCLCCYDVEATAVDLPTGAYTVRFCWEDHETGAEECHTQGIVIP